MTGTLHYLKALLAMAWMGCFGARGEFSALKSQTAMLVPDALPPDVCAELRSRIEVICSLEEHPRMWRDRTESDTRILGFEHEIGDLLEFFQIERWINAIDLYLGLKTRSWFLMANRVIPKEDNLGSGGGPHRDSPFSHQVKCIWYLSDVTAETGPFRYVPGTNSRLIKARDRYPLGEMRFNSVSDDMVEVHARAGTLLICDTKCIHGGKPIQSGARYAITLYTFVRPDGDRTVFRQLGLDPALIKPREAWPNHA